VETGSVLSPRTDFFPFAVNNDLKKRQVPDDLAGEFLLTAAGALFLAVHNNKQQ
jgi:hypothetical protein